MWRNRSCTVGGVAATLPVASLPAGSAIVCAITATAPANGVLALTGLTGATNDTQGGTGPGGNAKTGQDERIFVRGDKTIAYGRVAEVMAVITAAGYRKVALVTETDQKK